MTAVAKLAAECVKEILKEKDEKEKYLSNVKGLGSLIIQNGLAGAILFIKKKGSDKLIEHIDKIIKLQTGEEEFSQKIINGEDIPPQKYMQLQLAVLEGVKWLRRYADILLGGD